MTYDLTYKGQVLDTQTGKGRATVNFTYLLPVEEGVTQYPLEVVARTCGKEWRNAHPVSIYGDPVLKVYTDYYGAEKVSAPCAKDGRIKVEFNRALTSMGSLEVYQNGALVHTEVLNPGWTASFVDGLSVGEVKVRLVSDCTVPIEKTAKVELKNWYVDIALESQPINSYCEDYMNYVIPTVKVRNYYASEEEVQQAETDLKQGTYEVYQGNTLVASGNYADIPAKGIALLDIGEYTFHLRGRCASSSTFVQKFNVLTPAPSFYEFQVSASNGCQLGGVYGRLYAKSNRLPENVEKLQDYFSWEVFREDGTLHSTGKITDNGLYFRIGNLPAGKYKLKFFVTCEPNFGVTKEFEISSTQAVTPRMPVRIGNSCSSNSEGIIQAEFERGYDSYKIHIVRKSDNKVFYDKELPPSDFNFKAKLPFGDYTLTYAGKWNGCPYLPQTYDFTIGPENDFAGKYKLTYSKQYSSHTESIGSIQNLSITPTLPTSELPTYKLISLDGTQQTSTGVLGNYFYNLAPGLYKATATYGENCELSEEISITVVADFYSVPDLVCEGSTTPVGLGIFAKNFGYYDFSTKSLTFKIYKRTAPGAFSFTLVDTKTEPAGKIWTYFPGVLDDSNYDLYHFVVEMDGREIYRDVVKNNPKEELRYASINSRSTPTQYYNNTDQKIGSITAFLPEMEKYHYRFGGTHTWTLKNEQTQESFTKNVDSPIAPVTFDQLSKGNWYLTYTYDGGGCASQKYSIGGVLLRLSQEIFLSLPL